MFYLEPKFQTFHAENSLVKKLEPSDDLLTHQEAQLPLVFRSELRVSELIPCACSSCVCLLLGAKKKSKKGEEKFKIRTHWQPPFNLDLGAPAGFLVEHNLYPS